MRGKGEAEGASLPSVQQAAQPASEPRARAPPPLASPRQVLDPDGVRRPQASRRRVVASVRRSRSEAPRLPLQQLLQAWGLVCVPAQPSRHNVTLGPFVPRQGSYVCWERQRLRAATPSRTSFASPAPAGHRRRSSNSGSELPPGLPPGLRPPQQQQSQRPARPRQADRGTRRSNNENGPVIVIVAL